MLGEVTTEPKLEMEELKSVRQMEQKEKYMCKDRDEKEYILKHFLPSVFWEEKLMTTNM